MVFPRRRYARTISKSLSSLVPLLTYLLRRLGRLATLSSSLDVKIFIKGIFKLMLSVFLFNSKQQSSIGMVGKKSFEMFAVTLLNAYKVTVDENTLQFDFKDNFCLSFMFTCCST